MKQGGGKKWKVEYFDSAFGHGELVTGDLSSTDVIDDLLVALATWGSMADNADSAMVACLQLAAHADSRVREASVSSLGKLIPELAHSPAAAIAAISRALSDPDLRVRSSAEAAAKEVHEQTGIIITALPP